MTPANAGGQRGIRHHDKPCPCMVWQLTPKHQQLLPLCVFCPCDSPPLQGRTYTPTGVSRVSVAGHTAVRLARCPGISHRLHTLFALLPAGNGGQQSLWVSTAQR